LNYPQLAFDPARKSALNMCKIRTTLPDLPAQGFVSKKHRLEKAAGSEMDPGKGISDLQR